MKNLYKFKTCLILLLLLMAGGGAFSQVPTVTTQYATLITLNSVQLNGTVNPNSLATDVYFQYGTAPATYGAPVLAAESPLPAGNVNLPVTASVSGLSNNTKYYYRVYATNSSGTTYGPK